MRCPRCGSSCVTTCRHTNVEVSCSHCGFKIREEGKIETKIEEDFSKLLEAACDVITFREGTDHYESAKEVIEELQEKYNKN